MKCKSCGVNYDDSDKECPVCGMAVGKGQRGAMQYTTYDTGSDLPTRRPVGRSSAAPDAPMRGAPQGKSTAKSANLLLVVIVVLTTLIGATPALLQSIKNGLNNFAPQVTQSQPEANEEYDYLWISPGESFGSPLSTTLTDGSALLISFDDDAETYSLIQSINGKTVYEESGYVICAYNWPDEEYYEEGYGPPYESYSLRFDVTERTSGEPKYDELEQSFDFLLYQDLETNELILSNAFGAIRPYFAQEQMLNLYPIQSA